jgi:hypothetical protein
MLSRFPLIFDSGQFFDDLMQLRWSICTETGHHSIEEQDKWDYRYV